MNLNQAFFECLLIILPVMSTSGQMCTVSPLLEIVENCKGELNELVSFTFEPKPKNFKESLSGNYRVHFSRSRSPSVQSMKLGKCIRFSSIDLANNVAEFRGTFHLGVPQGQSNLRLKNGTQIQVTLNKTGHACGTQAHLNEAGEFVKITHWACSSEHWSKNGRNLLVYSKTSLDNRTLVTTADFQTVSACKTVNKMLNVALECQDLENPELTSIDNFVKPTTDQPINPSTGIFSARLDDWNRKIYANGSNQNCQDIDSWLHFVSSGEYLLSNHFKVRNFI